MTDDRRDLVLVLDELQRRLAALEAPIRDGVGNQNPLVIQVPLNTREIEALRMAVQDARSGRPSWDWLNPFEWWERAGEEGAARALRVFRGIVLLGMLAAALYKVSTWIDRGIAAMERDAGTPDAVIAVPLPDSVEALEIDASTVNVNPKEQ